MIHGSSKFLILQKTTFAFTNKSTRQIKNGKQRLCQRVSNKVLHDFGTDLGRKFRSLKIVPNLSEKLRRNLIRPKTLFFLEVYHNKKKRQTGIPSER